MTKKVGSCDDNGFWEETLHEAKKRSITVKIRGYKLALIASVW